jgi:uncharacterized protein (DUF433 family)
MEPGTAPVDKVTASKTRKDTAAGNAREVTIMPLTIELTPEEEARLQEQAQRAGLEAQEYARRLIAHLQESPLMGVIEAYEGIPTIAGTRIKVSMIAEETAMGRSPQAIQEQHSHLTFAQIYAALFYYSTHKADIDAQIEAEERHLQELRAQATHQDTLEALEERARQKGFTITPEGVQKTA